MQAVVRAGATTMSPHAPRNRSRPPSSEPLARPHRLADVAAFARARAAPDLPGSARAGAEGREGRAAGSAAAAGQAQVASLGHLGQPPAAPVTAPTRRS